jgi:hypothetical protein
MRLKVIAVLAVVVTLFSFQPAFATQFASTMTSSCVGTNVTSTYSLAIPVYVPQAATLTKVEVKTWDSWNKWSCYLLCQWEEDSRMYQQGIDITQCNLFVETINSGERFYHCSTGALR